MFYIKVKWRNEGADLPDIIVSELDPDRWENRKIEYFKDGRVCTATRQGHSGSTCLSIEPIPDDKYIIDQSEFTLDHISKSDFEELWRRAREQS